MKNTGVDCSPEFAARFAEKAGELTYADPSTGDAQPQIWRCSCKMYVQKWRAGVVTQSANPKKAQWWLHVAVVADCYVVSKAWDGAVHATMHLRKDPINDTLKADFAFTGMSDDGVLMEVMKGIDLDEDLVVNFTVDGVPNVWVAGVTLEQFHFAEILADTLAHTLY